MRPRNGILLPVAALLTAAMLAMQPLQATPIRGAWRIVRTSLAAGAQPDFRDYTQAGLILFTARHYSLMYVEGNDARKEFANPALPTEAEKLGAFDSFVGTLRHVCHRGFDRRNECGSGKSAEHDGAGVSQYLRALRVPDQRRYAPSHASNTPRCVHHAADQGRIGAAAALCLTYDDVTISSSRALTIYQPMNLTRIALSAIAALVAYFIVGGIFFAIPAMGSEFAKYPTVFRTGEAVNSVMLVGVLGLLIAIGAATVIFARMYPTGAGLEAGLKFGALLAVFVLGSFVIHSYMLLNIGPRLSILQGVAYASEWIVVGVVISLVYRG